MDKVIAGSTQAYFSLLRWRPNPARDEAKNVAVVMVEAEGDFGFVEWAPLSRISKRLSEQGLLDSAIKALHSRVHDKGGFPVTALKELGSSLRDSVTLTEPQITAISGDPEQTVKALYSAFVRPPSGGQPGVSKGDLTDRVISRLRRRKYDVSRSAYFEDYIFDVVLEGPTKRPVCMDVFSFAQPRKTWTDVEREAGHFLFALNRTPVRGVAIVEAPRGDLSVPAAFEAHERITRWLGDSDIAMLKATDFSDESVIRELIAT